MATKKKSTPKTGSAKKVAKKAGKVLTKKKAVVAKEATPARAPSARKAAPSRSKAPSSGKKVPASAKGTTSARGFKATKASARAFVSTARIPAPPPKGVRPRGPAAPLAFDALKEQAAVVGPDVISFVEGVPATLREDICNAALLAQLAANKKVPDRNNVFPWFDAYFGALMQLGWVVQQSGFKEYTEQVDGLETHKAIREVAALFLGPAPTALAVVLSTLDAMQNMDKDNPWITIFNREHRESKTTHFQISLADQDANGELMIYMMAFTLEASAKLTQILFFKLRKNKVTLRQNAAKATLDLTVLNSVRAALKKRLADRVTEFISTVEI